MESGNTEKRVADEKSRITAFFTEKLNKVERQISRAMLAQKMGKGSVSVEPLRREVEVLRGALAKALANIDSAEAARVSREYARRERDALLAEMNEEGVALCADEDEVAA